MNDFNQSNTFREKATTSGNYQFTQEQNRTHLKFKTFKSPRKIEA